jgi:hypothetical protein
VTRLIKAVNSWLNVGRCGLGRALSRCAKYWGAECTGDDGDDDVDGGARGVGSGDGSGGSGAGATWCWRLRNGCSRRRHVNEGASAGGVAAAAAVGDLPPRAVICSLGQPSTLSFKIFKSDLKDGESVDLDKEWIYLMEGDKYCTLAGKSSGAGAAVPYTHRV